MQTETVPVEAAASSLGRFRAGVWRGLAIALVLSLTLLYVGSMTGYLVITVGEFPALVELWQLDLRQPALIAAAVRAGVDLVLRDAEIVTRKPRFSRCHLRTRVPARPAVATC